MALTFDAEANMRDGQEEVSHHATHFKNAYIIGAEAVRARNTAATYGPDGPMAAGRRSGTRGRAAQDIGLHASDDHIASLRNERASPEAARVIANVAPGDAAAQSELVKRFASAPKSKDGLATAFRPQPPRWLVEVPGCRRKSLSRVPLENKARTQ